MQISDDKQSRAPDGGPVVGAESKLQTSGLQQKPSEAALAQTLELHEGMSSVLSRPDVA